MKNQTTTQAPVNLSTNQAGQGKVHLLSAHGYFAGNRDAKIKPEFSGRFMVRDTQDQDGFCIVGDDLSDLVLEALEHLDIDLENFLNVEYRKYVNDVAEGDPMQFDDWLTGSDIPEIVAARQLLEGKVESANDDAIHDIVEDVLERAVKHDFRPDEDMVRGAVEGSANLLNLILTERQVTDACARILDRINEPDGASTTAFEVTVEDVVNVLCSNSLAVANTSSKSFESMASELYGNLDFHLIEQAALAGDELDEQTNYANDEIARQLREKGVLEPLKSACDSPSPGM